MDYKPTWNEFYEECSNIMKYRIDLYYHCHYERKPTKQEYIKHFEDITKNLKCIVTNSDIGKFCDLSDDEWFKPCDEDV